MKSIYYFPQKNLMISLPSILVIAVIAGIIFDTSLLSNTILIATMLIIYPTMIGMPWQTLLNLDEKKQISYAMGINFILIPIIALGIGFIFLSNHPVLFAGLILVSLLPTSGMTISWTAISNGNVSAAIKLTVFGLIAGAMLAPFYLQVLVGQIVDIKMLSIMRTILMVIFVPLLLGAFTTMLLKRKIDAPVINQKVKPKLQPISLWAMHYIIFVSISMRAEMILKNWELIGLSLIVLIFFYAIIFTLITWIAKSSFNRADALSLIYGTTLRNLSIAMGIGITAFGAEAALLITIAFMFQQQAIVLFNRFVVPKLLSEQDSFTSQIKQVGD